MQSSPARKIIRIAESPALSQIYGIRISEGVDRESIFLPAHQVISMHIKVWEKLET